VYLLAKLQLHILITTELQHYKVATTEQSICTANKLQALTKKTVEAYKPIEVQSNNFHHCTHHEQGNGLLGKFFLYLSFFTACKSEIHEQKSIAYNHFDVT